MLRPAAAPHERLQLDFLPWLVRIRFWLFAAVGIPQLLSFNGLWRPHLDSSIYRGIARSLVRGDGYTFAEQLHTHVYPGFPYILAVLHWIHDGPLLPLLVINVMAIATLAAMYHLIRLHYPAWMAVVGVVGVGLNARFLEYSQEILTDIPFLLGLVMSILAFENVRLAHTRNTRAGWIFVLAISLAFSASLRPTFWVLAVAIALVCVHGFLTDRPRRGLYLLGVGLIILVTIGLSLIDPRTRGFNPIGGTYEREFLGQLRILREVMPGNIKDILFGAINELFFGQEMQPLSIPITLLMLWGTILLCRRQPLWAMPTLVLVPLTMVLSAPPRYYLMVLPMLWVGWMLVGSRITLRLPAGWQGPIFGLWLGIPMLLNGGDFGPMISDQRRPDFAWLRDRSDRQATLMATMDQGNYADIPGMVELVKNNVQHGQTVIAPRANLLAYLADRRVVGEHPLFINRSVTLYPRALADAKPTYAMFPADIYRKKDENIERLIRAGVMTPRGAFVAEIPESRVYLATPRLAVPNDDWRSPGSVDAARKAVLKRETLEQMQLDAQSKAVAEEADRIRRARKERESIKAAAHAEAIEQARLEAIRKAAKERRDRDARNAARERRERDVEPHAQQDQQHRRDAAAAKERKAAKDRKGTSRPTTVPAN